MRSASRLVIIALLGLFLALPVAPAAAASVDSAAPADEEVVVQPTTTAPATTTAPPGPTIQPDTEAEEAESRRKLIMGVASVVLLGLVVWGRSIRRKRRKAAES